MALFEKKESSEKKASPALDVDTVAAQTLANGVLLGGRITEKSYLLNTMNQYVFRVSRGATKDSVRRAVEIAYGVHAEKVRIVNIPRKAKVFGRTSGFTSAIKKAIVTLPKGEEITMFKGA